MREMFYDCSALEYLGLSSFDTSKVTNMARMFCNNSNLESIQLPNFNTSKVTNMNQMFSYCTKLTDLDISSFDTSSVTDMGVMFAGCVTIESIDLSCFDTSKVTSMEYMFADGWGPRMGRDMNLRKIIVSDGFVTNALKSKDVMFVNCPYLVGDAGTVYDNNNNSYTYARIDGGVSNPGYFTRHNGMYRLYNANSGEHFYTSSLMERKTLASAGWTYEGIAWHAPGYSNTPIYRLFNPNAKNSANIVVGDHHYTASAVEKDKLLSLGWQYEGIGWYSGGSVPLFRLYNPNADSGSHHYTPSEEEKDNLVTVGWNYEGISWYGL